MMDNGLLTVAALVGDGLYAQILAVLVHGGDILDAEGGNQSIVYLGGNETDDFLNAKLSIFRSC